MQGHEERVLSKKISYAGKLFSFDLVLINFLVLILIGNRWSRLFGDSPWLRLAEDKTKSYFLPTHN